MPLSGQQRLALRRQLNPAADQRLYGRLNQALARFIRPGATVLDAGAGPGTWILNRYRRQVGLAVGADVAFPPGHQAATGEVPVIKADLPALDGDDALEDTMSHQVSAAVSDPSLWDPMPVTLPTYVSKPAAERTVRTIDLDSTGVWSSGRNEADSQIAREADAQRAEADAGTESEQRATGS